LGSRAYYASQGDSEKAQEAFTNAAWSGVGLIPFGNILGKGGKWLGKTKVGQWGGDALEALGKTKVGQWGGDALEWAGKQGGKAVDWLGQQGGKALDWAGKQREKAISWGSDALNWAGKQGDNLLKPLDDLLTGRNLEMAGVPRGAVPDISAPTPTPRPKSPTPSPHSKAPNVDPANPARVEPEAPAPRNADKTADISDAKPESVPARESSVSDSGRVESDQLSDRQIKNELDHIKDNPNIVEGTPPNRKAKIGEHEWHEQPGGGWCRHSNGEVCVPGTQVPKSDYTTTDKGKKREPITDQRIISELPSGEVRTPEELEKARQYFKNRKPEARRRWEERTGEKWPIDPATGQPARASHPRPLADGGDPMVVEPAFGDPNTEHMIPDPVTGKTDQQRFGSREGTKPRGGKREPITDQRVISELPSGEVRTPEELEKARQYFKNRKPEARRRWEERTGEKWPIDPATGQPARASHPRPLADGGDPMVVEPAFGGSNTEHMIPDPVTRKTDQQRFGGRRRNKDE
jgi:vacuolar-type H+-ATPase subunit H